MTNNTRNVDVMESLKMDYLLLEDLETVDVEECLATHDLVIINWTLVVDTVTTQLQSIDSWLQQLTTNPHHLVSMAFRNSFT